VVHHDKKVDQDEVAVGHRLDGDDLDVLHHDARRDACGRGGAFDDLQGRS
jgi:hypothetical protein